MKLFESHVSFEAMKPYNSPGPQAGRAFGGLGDLVSDFFGSVNTLTESVFGVKQSREATTQAANVAIARAQAEAQASALRGVAFNKALPWVAAALAVGVVAVVVLKR